MNMTRCNDAHEPARTRQEAAMLPAMAKRVNHGRLLMPQDETVFRPVETMTEAAQVSEQPTGSMTGRSVLRSITLPGIGCMRSGKRPRRMRNCHATHAVQIVPVDCYLCRR